MQKFLDTLYKYLPMLKNGKTHIASLIGIVFGVLVALGVLTPDLHQQAQGFSNTLLDQLVDVAQKGLDFLVACGGLWVTLRSIVTIFQRVGVAKAQKAAETAVKAVNSAR